MKQSEVMVSLVTFELLPSSDICQHLGESCQQWGQSLTAYEQSHNIEAPWKHGIHLWKEINA